MGTCRIAVTLLLGETTADGSGAAPLSFSWEFHLHAWLIDLVLFLFSSAAGILAREKDGIRRLKPAASLPATPSNKTQILT
jgi:hypothetical protein